MMTLFLYRMTKIALTKACMHYNQVDSIRPADEVAIVRIIKMHYQKLDFCHLYFRRNKGMPLSLQANYNINVTGR